MFATGFPAFINGLDDLGERGSFLLLAMKRHSAFIVATIGQACFSMRDLMNFSTTLQKGLDLLIQLIPHVLL